MGYLDATGTQTLWNNIKANFGHEIQTSSLSTNGITISLNSGAKTGGNFNQLSTALIPAATNTTGGLITNAQAQAIASIKTYTAGTGLTLSGNQFSHATGAGYNHIPTGGSSGQVLKWSSNGTAQWASEYSYTLPTATASTLGGVKVGDNLTIEDGVLSAEVPATLPNPSALTFTGEASATYDGSSAVSVNIPKGIFIALYNSTKYAEIQLAFGFGKMVYVCINDTGTQTNTTNFYPLIKFQNNTSCTFGRTYGSETTIITCSKNSVWSLTKTTCAILEDDNTFLGTNSFGGVTTAVTPSTGDNSTNIATTEFVQNSMPTIPATLPNPYTLTIGNTDNYGIYESVDYDGSTNGTLTIENETYIVDYVEDETSECYEPVKEAVEAHKLVYIKKDNTHYRFTGMDEATGNLMFANIYYVATENKLYLDQLILDQLNVWTEDLLAYDLYGYDRRLRNYAKLAGADFTGTVTVQTPTADSNPTTKKYVDDAIATAISGGASYGGTVASESELLAKDYKSGMYYVVAVASGSSWSGYENGDMFFAHTDKGTSPSLDDFDCVQTNITAMTDTEINSICTLD